MSSASPSSARRRSQGTGSGSGSGSNSNSNNSNSASASASRSAGERRVPPIAVSASGHQAQAPRQDRQKQGKAHTKEPQHYAAGADDLQVRSRAMSFDIPHLNCGRHNLTALSQHHNLFFVVHFSCVCVYEPRYPDQAVTFGNQTLILSPPPTRLDLAGFMNPLRPEDINHLVVAELGNQEILVGTRDGGDVFAYHVNQIAEAVRRQQQLAPNVQTSDGAATIRPFFQRCLGASAWGIAVHKEARMIAFSANSRIITVFAFGLSKQETVEQATRKAHVNSLTPFEDDDDDDFGGVSLGSTDAHRPWSGHVDSPSRSLYDGFRGACSNMHNEHDGSSRGHSACNCSGYPDKCFSKELFDSREQDFVLPLGGSISPHKCNIPCIAFCNTPEDPTGRFLISSDINAVTCVWDLREARVCRVHQRAAYDEYVQHGIDGRRSGWGLLWLDKKMFSHAASLREATGTRILSWPATSCDVLSTKRCLHHLPGRDKVWAMPSRQQPRVPPEQAYVDDTSSPPDTPRLGPVSDAHMEELELQIGHDPSSWHRQIVETLGPQMYGAVYWPFLTMKSANCEPSIAVPDTPLMHLSMQTIHLFQTADFHEASQFNPAIFIDKPLAQKVVDPPDLLQHLDRMNLHAQIPELGVVIVGSGVGRAAVLTLHQTEQKPIRTGRSSAKRLGAASLAKPIYTFRVDHLLPFYQQEADGQRPQRVLVGLAVSPLQTSRPSRRAATAARRWRLILTYQDFTTLSYEIGGVADGQGIGMLV